MNPYQKTQEFSGAVPGAGERGAPRLRLPPEVRMAQILDAALLAFAESGYAATRMDDIAQRCGLSKGGLYAHFASKDEIFEALLERSLAPPDWSVLQPPGPQSAPQALAVWIVDQLYGVLAQPSARAMLRLLVAEGERVPHLVQRWGQDLVQPYIALFGEVLRQRRAARGEPEGVLEQAPWLVLSPMVHALLSSVVFAGRQPITLEQARAAHVQLLATLIA